MPDKRITEQCHHQLMFILLFPAPTATRCDVPAGAPGRPAARDCAQSLAIIMLIPEVDPCAAASSLGTQLPDPSPDHRILPPLVLLPVDVIVPAQRQISEFLRRTEASSSIFLDSILQSGNQRRRFW